MGRRARLRVVVTGAEGAFGRALVERLEQRGEVVRGIDQATPTRVGNHACDITDADAVRSVVAGMARDIGGIDVLVNAAGIGSSWPVSEMPGDYERRTLDVNLLGTWHATSAALPWLLESRGHVVNVASLLALVTLPWVGAYTASKRAVCAFSDVLRAEHRADGLTVSTVYPGYVATPIHEHGEARSGMTLKGAVPEESVEQVVRALERAIDRRRRDMATSRGGAVALRVGRHAPALLDRLVQARVRRRGLGRPTAFPDPRVEPGGVAR